MLTKRIRKIKIVAEKSNPGEIVVLTAEAKPCEEFNLHEDTYTRNPDKVNLLVLNHPLVRFNIFNYKTNPELLGLAINNEYIFLNPAETKLVHNVLTETLKGLRKLNPEEWWKHRQKYWRKRYTLKKQNSEEGWVHRQTLKPKSYTLKKTAEKQKEAVSTGVHTKRRSKTTQTLKTEKNGGRKTAEKQKEPDSTGVHKKQSPKTTLKHQKNPKLNPST